MLDVPNDLAYHTPGLHPRLTDPALREQLTQSFRARQWVRVQPFLAPGLAAELAALLPGLQLTPQLDSTRREQSWRCIVAMPPTVDLQYPACMYRLGALLVRDLPTLVSEIAGHRVHNTEPIHIDIHVLRKGSYLDGRPAPLPALGSPGAGVDFAIGLTGADWPSEWGGHLHIAKERVPMPWNALDLFGHTAVQIPLITRHVQGLTVMGHLPATSPQARLSADASSDTANS